MAKSNQTDRGSWLLAEELLDSGDPAFVDELRRISEPERLGKFAAKWYADRRPNSRKLLLEYLDQPLNAFHHEPLVKRLFKLAENAEDDELMSRFLVVMDRSVRRARRTRSRYDWDSREFWTEETIRVPSGTAMPRTERELRYQTEPEKLRLFSVATRYYLRRRAWRYFRQLGDKHPGRYLTAIVEALKQYTDEDVADGLALLDNWGLVHALFHNSPALLSKANGWTLADGHTLAELAPAPIFEPLWKQSSEPLVDLLLKARCRPVRQWTIQMIRAHHPGALAKLPLPELLSLLGHEDSELAQLAIDALRQSPSLNNLTVDEWLKLLDSANPQTLDTLCELMVERLDSRAVDLEQAGRLACSRPLPVARMGFRWLRERKPFTTQECEIVLGLADAEAVPLRPEMVRWARGVLADSAYFTNEWVLRLLDSRHADVRAEAWEWFLEEARAAQDVTMWQRLLETPYDDIRFRLIDMLDQVATNGSSPRVDRSKLNPELVRFLWASVLLNIHRGSRVKPRVAGQILDRLLRQPDEAETLLPIVGVLLRSVRGPEWRSGLAGVVKLVECRPDLESMVRREFPELNLLVQV